MSFELRNKLMIKMEDNLSAYGTANKFVQDDEQKYIVFERCFNRVIHNDRVDIDSAASMAADKAEQLWVEYEKPDPKV